MFALDADNLRMHIFICNTEIEWLKDQINQAGISFFECKAVAFLFFGFSPIPGK